MNPYYSDDWVDIYNCDCMELLPSLPKFDLVLTDPPYGLGGKLKPRGGMIGNSFEGMGESSWDNRRPDKSMILEVIDKAEVTILWGGNYFIDYLEPTQCFLIWDKMNGTNPMADVELAWTNIKNQVARIYKLHHFSAGYGHKSHPTQKPLGLFKWCIELSKTSGFILDPFAGSCTTGVAAKELNRKAILIEISEKYCEIGAKRCSQEVFNFYEERQ